MSRRSSYVLTTAVATVALVLAQGVAAASPRSSRPGLAQLARLKATVAKAADGIGDRGDDDDLAANLEAYALERSLPAASVTGTALLAARAQQAALPASAGAWREVTNTPFNANPSSYTDPFWSNVGSGFSIVGGRVTALVAASTGAWFAGTADGGVWRSTNQGATWTPTFDKMPSLSIGALAINPADKSLWVGTGEANTNADAYLGAGVYRSTDGGSHYQLVGDNALASHTIYRITFTRNGTALAATDDGLWRLTAHSRHWQEVLDPAGPNQNPPYLNQVTDVTQQPGHAGEILAVVGWRSATPGDDDNGFFVSTNDGATFHKITPTGDIDASDIGRTTFAYAADGSKLYAVIESPAALAAGAESVLQGVFRSDSGDPAGPWTKIADEAKLAASGSALAVGSGYGVGVQAWYNEDLTVDPANSDHVYVGLEEVFESTNAGTDWTTASPYWNYGLACGTSCPNTTHPDQHAIMLTAGKVVIGNDGGVYYRPLSDHHQYGDWTDTNATLHDLQYYDARTGALPGHRLGTWGGLQDNGTSVLGTNTGNMVEPAGGDGFNVIVDPADARRAVGEYTDGTMYATTDGGHTFTNGISPGCDAQATVGLTPRADCDPGARFSTPYVSDQTNINHWVFGGEDVWTSDAAWKTHCNPTGCTWTKQYDTGAGNAVTALSSAHGVIYAAWVGGGGNPGPAFTSGIATNAGGTWHEVNTATLPNRYIAGMTVDPANPLHAYAIYNGYSRRWIPSAGTGHVFETVNGGTTWRDISTNLPDAPADALVIDHGQLVLGTDIGAFIATEGQAGSTRWRSAGHGLPNASVNNITLGPDGRTVYAATHGRGIWSYTVH